MNKHSILKNEIDYILDQGIRSFVEDTLDTVPDSFYSRPASWSNLHHPVCTHRSGGLIVHTKRAVYLLNNLCEGWGLKGLNRDIAIAAMILHDTDKDNYKDHPLTASKHFILNSAMSDCEGVINSCIVHHMGLWTPEKVRKPLENYTLEELAVYTCDYLSSRKDLVTPVDSE